MASLYFFQKGALPIKVVYQTCCGVDVHKSFLVATIIKTTSGVQPSYQKKRFSTFNNSILEFKKWLLNNSCRDICMEFTGKYWVPVFNLLEDEINVTIANPKWVKAVKGNKDDTKDSKWIGDLFRLGLVPGNYIPCKPFRILREFTRYRYKLTSCRSSKKKRFQNALTVCNVALDSVVSDIFGKSATSVIDYLLDQSDNSINHEEISSRLLRSLKKKSESVIESIEGYQMTDSQKYRMRLVHAHMDYITSTIADIDSMIHSLVEPYEDAIQLESAGKKKSVRITRAGVYLKPALVQFAHAAVKSKNSPYYKAKYERITKRRGKKRAIIAIARMILTAAYHMLSTGEVWNPTNPYKIDMPEPLKNKQKEKAVKQAMKLLIAEGLIEESKLAS